jgi:malate dehydrogenase (oxaloacetate-decarboxylating)(NADP+)
MVFPNLDAANIALGLVKSIDNGLMIGPILLNAAMPVHIVTPSTSARGIFNMSAIAVYDAQKTDS